MAEAIEFTEYICADCLFEFYAISIFVGYSMPNQLSYK